MKNLLYLVGRQNQQRKGSSIYAWLSPLTKGLTISESEHKFLELLIQTRYFECRSNCLNYKLFARSLILKLKNLLLSFITLTQNYYNSELIQAQPPLQGILLETFFISMNFIYILQNIQIRFFYFFIYTLLTFEIYVTKLTKS